MAGTVGRAREPSGDPKRIGRLFFGQDFTPSVSPERLVEEVQR
jgi:hypothetical protein